MNLLDLTGKHVLITGGCGAIGRVVIRVLAEHGATISVNDRLSNDEAHHLLSEAGVHSSNVQYYQADVTEPAEVEHLFQEIEACSGVPTIVCCHAGITEAHPITHFPLESFDALFKVNVRSAFLVAQYASQHWIKEHLAGHLIFTTSWVQDIPWPDITPYNASKAGLKALMRGFARELAGKGIRANAIAPGIVNVGLAKQQWETDPSYRKRAEKAIPLGVLQDPETIAHTFLFLCSPMANYMTGSTLLVDGGCSLYPMDDTHHEE